MPNERPEPMTGAQKRQLESELAQLEGPRRAEVIQAIARRGTISAPQRQTANLMAQDLELICFPSPIAHGEGSWNAVRDSGS